MPRASSLGCACPQCGGSTKVINTRQDESGGVRRRRKCWKCNIRFSTLEQFSGWDGRTEGMRGGARSKFSPEAQVLREAQAAAAAVPVGKQTFMAKWWDPGHDFEDATDG